MFGCQAFKYSFYSVLSLKQQTKRNCIPFYYLVYHEVRNSINQVMNQRHSGKGNNIGGNQNIDNSREIRVDKGNYFENVGDVIIKNDAPTPQRDKNQQVLLDYTKDIIEGLLNKSLRNQVYITLDKVTDETKVIPPIQLKFADEEAQLLPTETTIIEVYDRPDINKRLLILGHPGSGKSMSLYKLGEELVQRAKNDIHQPIPVLFNLSSWTSNYSTIEDWLIDELVLNYGFNRNKKLAKQYIRDQLIIPLLDGLNELVSDRQFSCVNAINTFLQPNHWKKPLVVCSRLKAFELLQTRIGLNGAVILQPLSDEQIEIYLKETEAEYLSDLIQSDKDWHDLAETPLFLNIMVLITKGSSLKQWQELKTKDAKLFYLFEKFIYHQLENQNLIESRHKNKIRKTPKEGQKILKSYLPYIKNPPQSRRYLTWLAWQLKKNKQTVFLIENLQPTDLANSKQRCIYG